MALTKVSTPGIKDEAITLAKLLLGDSNNDGKFLRANNGADPTFETVTGTTINNNADNRLITGSGTANTLNGEANLTFDGSNLGINGDLVGSNNTTLYSSNGGSGVRAGIALSGSDQALKFYTVSGGSERMRIDSSGNVGIGTTSPVRHMHLNGSDSNTVQLHITNSTTGTTGSDGVSFALGSDESLIINQRESNHIALKTADTERMRIDSSGNVGIGNNNPDQKLKIQDSNDVAIHILKTGSQDTLIKNTGQTEICAASGGASGQRIAFKIGANTGSLSDIAKFTDSGLCFGSATAAANALNDYEEGTWTPAPEFGGSLSGASYSIANCNYTKIGRSVHLKGNINFSNAGSSTGGFKITGLPFTDDFGGSYSHAVGSVIVFFGPNADGSMNCFTSGTQLRFRMHNEADGNNEPQHSDFDNDTKIMFAITYITNS